MRKDPLAFLGNELDSLKHAAETVVMTRRWPSGTKVVALLPYAMLNVTIFWNGMRVSSGSCAAARLASNTVIPQATVVRFISTSMRCVPRWS